MSGVSRRISLLRLLLAVGVFACLAPSAFAADYRATVLADSPQGYWRLGESLGATTAVDASGNGNHGTYVGPTLGATGALLNDADKAASFLTGNTVDLSGGSSSKFGFTDRSAFSVELWVKPKVVDTFRTQIRKGSSSAGNRWNVEISSEFGIAFNRTVGGVNYGPHQLAEFKPLAGRWYHVVGTYDGTSLVLYVDGYRRGSVDVDQRSLPANTDPAIIGPNASSDLDEVAIYPAALSPERVLAHFQAGLGDLGQRRYSRFEGFDLNDRHELQVNVANGNLLVRAEDLSAAGTGLELQVERWYNSATADARLYGVGWLLNTGHDVRLFAAGDGSMVFLGPSGYRVAFQKQPDGSYRSPAAVDATLVTNANGTHTLTWNRSDQKYEFSGSGRFLKVVDRNGNAIETDWSGGVFSGLYDTRGRHVSVARNGAGWISGMTDWASRSWSYGYDAAGHLTSYTDANGKQTSYSYDANHRLSKIVTPGGRETRITYDEKGRVQTLTRITDPGSGAGSTTTFAYFGDRTEVTDARGNKTKYFVEDPGRVHRVENAKGRSVATTYTSNSNVQTYTAASGAGGSNAYSTDGRENLVSSTSPSGSVRKWEYDAVAHPYQPKSETDEQGAVYDRSYDAKGNLTKMTLRRTGAVVASYTYNANGTMASYTDARGKVTSYVYDSLGQRTRTDYPAPLADETYTYDNLGRLQTVTDGNGKLRTYSYDALDRVTSIAYPDATITYGYDADGNQTSQSDGLTTISTTYDALNRVLTETRPLGVTTYTWDSVGNLISVANPGGTVSYGYDELNLVTSVTEPGGKLTSLSYNDDDQPLTTTLPNGVVVSRSYASGRLTALTQSKASTTLASSQYTFTSITPAGEPERDAALVKTVTDENGHVTTYGYDVDQGFLTSAVKRDGSGAVVGGYDYQYGYDLMGNRVSETKAGVTTSAVFNDANQLVSRGSVSFSYDPAGNLLSSSAGAAYSYNARNQSSALKRPGGLNQTQKYAGASQFERVEKDQGSGSFTQFGESLLGMLIRKEGGATYYTRLPDGTLLSQRTPAGTHYYLYDGLGSVVGMSDDTGAVVARYTYDPYGQVVSQSGPYNPWRFKGGYQSQTTLHYKFGHRWYDPALGRWTQADPLEQPTTPGDWNRYAYVGGDPVNSVDDTGLFGWRDAVKVTAGVVTVAAGLSIIYLSVAHVAGCIGGAATLGGFSAVVAAPLCIKAAGLGIAAGATLVILGGKLINDGRRGR